MDWVSFGVICGGILSFIGIATYVVRWIVVIAKVLNTMSEVTNALRDLTDRMDVIETQIRVSNRSRQREQKRQVGPIR